MQLNESTYETIFLLYIDKELSPKERLEVETFIADNSSYASEMEALKATILSAENIPYAFKENLKQQGWNATYSTIIKEDLQAIPGLSTSFKNTLKKETVSQGKIITQFRFNQNKFTYAAIAACLIVFVGYQQLTKGPAANSSASNSLATSSNKVLVPNISTKSTGLGGTEVSYSNKQQLASNIEPLTKRKQEILSVETSSASELEIAKTNQKESIVIAEPTLNNSVLNNQAIISKLQSSYNNPMAIDAVALTISSANIDAEPTEVEKVLTSYEIIDTEDPDRTIFIANFEIDGNKLRGLKRKVTSLFKNNKSERNK